MRILWLVTERLVYYGKQRPKFAFIRITIELVFLEIACTGTAVFYNLEQFPL